VLVALARPLAIPFAVHILCWLLWGLSIVYHVYRYWPHSYDTQQYWVWQVNGDWVNNTEPAHTVMQLKHAIVTAWFILVRLRSEHATRHCIFFADQLDADTWRRLRVRLGGCQANVTCSSGARW